MQRTIGVCVFFGATLTVLAAPAQINVNVNPTSVRAIAPLEGLGMGTAVYANQFANANLDERLNEAGVTTLRYSGGGYADVYHWSVHKDSPFGGTTDRGYVAPATTFPGLVNIMNNMGNGQAVLTVNYGSALKLSGSQTLAPDFGGQPHEAAAWVAYANSDPSIYGTINDIDLGVDAQGNDWRTAGYWAKLRASTQAEYQSWATTDGVYNSLNNFLAVNRDQPVGVKYWEIGNETFGTGYYGGGNGYSTDYHVPYDGTNRNAHPDLSPAHYGQQVVQYSQLMKQVDPTIKIGAVLSTPPDDYSWAGSGNGGWNEQVLNHAATNITIPGVGQVPATDFVMVHWYPFAGNNANGNNLLAFPRTKIGPMINGTTSGFDTGTNAGVRDSLTEAGIPNAEIMITEFNYMGSLDPAIKVPANAIFVADSYASWLELGVKSVQYLELSKNEFVGDQTALTRGEAFYSIKMLNTMFDPGDAWVTATSSSNNVRVHSVRQEDGTVAVLLLNVNTAAQSVNVTIGGEGLDSDGTLYSSTGTGITTTSASNLGNTFSVSVPGRTMYLYTIQELLGDMDENEVVDADDIDLLCQLIDSQDPEADVNGNSVIDQDDMDYMIATILGTAYGDADLDGDVDGGDFDAWRIRDSLGDPIGWATGDFDFDGDVDGGDFDLWRERPTAIAGGALQPVPEPATLSLLAVGAFAICLSRTRLSRRSEPRE